MSNLQTNFKDDLDKVTNELGITVLKYGASKYKNKSTFKCSCGVTFLRSASAMISSKRPCLECSAKITSARCAATQSKVYWEREYDNVKKKLEDKGYTIHSMKKAKHKRLLCDCTCNSCGIRCEKLSSSILRYKCGCFSNTVKKTPEQYKEELISVDCGFHPIEDYIASRTPIKHKCSRCNDFEVTASPTNMLKTDKVRCPNCDLASSFYLVDVGRNRFKVRGFERFVIKSLCKRFKAKNIVLGCDAEMPVIKIGKHSKHIPDFYIRNENLLIEVKSLCTAGLLDKYGIGGADPKSLFKLLQSKHKHAVASGFKYLLILVSNSGDQIKLPKDWASMPRKKVITYLNQDHHH